MAQQQQARWQPTRRQVLWAGIVAALAFLIIVICGYLFEWKWIGLPKRKLWDWLELLIIPAVLAGGGLWFNRQQREQELQSADRRAQDEALQTYLDQMSGMLIPSSKDLPSLYKARPGDSLSSVARARTLTVLPRLDGDRKARVVQFLYESGLIYSHRPILDLSGADLREADLSLANLQEANLQEANLSRAHLYSADLRGADLRRAKLYWADLDHANLSDALLIQADLSHANLNGTDLTGAILREADLRDVSLRRASLRGASGLTEEELAAAVPGVAPVEFALEGATMPNGRSTRTG